jgi:hypothetical protein
MHVKYEFRITWFFVAAGAASLCIMITLTISDYVTRNHPPRSNPKGEPVFASEKSPHLPVNRQ